MQKVALVAPLKQKEEVLQELQKEGMMEIIDAPERHNVDHTEVHVRAAEVDYAIDTLKDVASKETMKEAQRVVTEEDIVESMTKCDLRGIVSDLQELEKKDTELSREQDEARALIEELRVWKNYLYALKVTTSSSHTESRFGVVQKKVAMNLKNEIEKKIQRSVVEVFPIDKASSLVAVTVWKDDHKVLDSVIAEFGWEAHALPGVDGSAEEATQNAQKKIEELKTKKQSHTKKREELSVDLPHLMRTRTYMNWLDSKQSARETSVESLKTFSLLGWIPKKEMQKLQGNLAEKVSAAVQIFAVRADENEVPPVKLKNPIAIKPYESVTTLYGLPQTSEFDPTPLLTPFFALFFALCLTDAGYGLVLALIFGGYLLKTRKNIHQAQFVWLLFISGVLTFFISILFGGWFGMTPEQAPAFMTKETADGLLFKGQIWDLTSEDGIAFFQNLSLILGLTQIFFGIFLAGWHKWLHGRKLEAFWMDFTYHILFGAIILYVVFPQALTQWLLIASIVMFVWGKGYGAKWYLRPIMGILGTLNFSISFISNSLSYLRLLALGLVTGAIALAVNQVAGEVGKLLPVWASIPVVIMILIGGHVVSIALNTLGSFVHSGRLQYIEFFGLFFEGGGKPFSPFSRSIH